MAHVTKKQLLEASEIVESNYGYMVDELLTILAEYVGNDVDDYTLAKKYAKLGILTDEAVSIISHYTNKSIDELTEIFEYLTKISLNDIEKQFKEAEKKGLVKQIGELSDSVLINTLIASYVSETSKKLAGMNNVILNSVLNTYQTGINDVIQEKNIEIERKIYEQTVNVPENAQEFINQAIYETAYEREITQKAITKAVQKMADDGITGFIDNAGRSWHPDTYSAMVVRTNAHNIAIDAVKTRQEEYGSDIFQVSSHTGARPLCYPYQGKLLSWSHSGVFEDGSGAKYEYDDIDNTSYGEPAGLFGINCGHYPMPIIPGVSIVREMEIQDEEENDIEYRESQKQRYLERQIRQAKRDYEMQRKSGADDEVLKQYKQRVSNTQQNMRDFIDETGRARRYDREKIVNSTVPAELSKKDNKNIGYGDRYENKATRIPSGISGFHKNDSLYEFSTKIKPYENYFDVVIHGGTDGLTFGSASKLISISELVEIIKTSPNYKIGQPIRLLSCNTGYIDEDTGYYQGQLLANALGVEVIAPNDSLYIYENGNIKVGKGGKGAFVTFTPKEIYE